jgi:hypothetical protein
MLLVVVAVVLYLATKAWKNTLPTAAEIARPGSTASTAGEGTPGSGEAPPVRPSLREMKQNTDAHSSAVRHALDQAQ